MVRKDLEVQYPEVRLWWSSCALQLVYLDQEPRQLRNLLVALSLFWPGGGVHTLRCLNTVYSFRTGLKPHPTICDSSLLLRVSTRMCFLCRANHSTFKQEIFVEHGRSDHLLTCERVASPSRSESSEICLDFVTLWIIPRYPIPRQLKLVTVSENIPACKSCPIQENKLVVQWSLLISIRA